jgi:hypothetical protein
MKGDKRFHVGLRFVAEAGDPDGRSRLARAEGTLLQEVIPVIKGRDVEPTEPLG